MSNTSNRMVEKNGAIAIPAVAAAIMFARPLAEHGRSTFDFSGEIKPKRVRAAPTEVDTIDGSRNAIRALGRKD